MVYVHDAAVVGILDADVDIEELRPEYVFDLHILVHVFQALAMSWDSLLGCLCEANLSRGAAGGNTSPRRPILTVAAS